jgi:pimeloyl-ACP methyl ester carboxylesterase
MTTGSVLSKDGTRIGYLRVGQGPAVVLLHGSNESARSHTQLALALADAFTVYLPDRRGRGLSGPTAPTTASAPRSRTSRPSLPGPAPRRSSGSASAP